MNALLYKVVKLSLPPDLAIELFDRTVVPVLTYGCEVWGFEDCEKVEVLHRKFLKRLLGLSYTAPNHMVYGECGRTKLQSVILPRMVGFG